jgi:predicted transposase/invertase (TIGR01784 family)
MKTRTLISFDYALKRLLRHKANHRILEGFLNELLKRQVKIRNILDGESNQESADSKQTRVDMLVEDESGELMIIEVQYQHEIDYLLRMLFGVSQNIVDHMIKGQPYKEIKKVYSINIVYFTMGEGDDYIYHGKTDFKGMHTKNLLLLSEIQRQQFGKEAVGDLYPEYYIIDVKNFDDVAKDTLDEWIYYLKNSTIKDDFKAQGMDQVRSVLDYDKLSSEEKKRYNKELDRKLGWDSAIETARMDGREEGESVGMRKGLEKMVINGNRMGLSVEQIQALTGLDAVRITELLKREELEDHGRR